jgi:hypothetical protein
MPTVNEIRVTCVIYVRGELLVTFHCKERDFSVGFSLAQLEIGPSKFEKNESQFEDSRDSDFGVKDFHSSNFIYPSMSMVIS